MDLLVATAFAWCVAGRTAEAAAAHASQTLRLPRDLTRQMRVAAEHAMMEPLLTFAKRAPTHVVTSLFRIASVRPRTTRSATLATSAAAVADATEAEEVRRERSERQRWRESDERQEDERRAKRVRREQQQRRPPGE